MLAALRDFLRLEAASGVLLMTAAAAALIIANSPLSGAYRALLDVPVMVSVGEFALAKPLKLWINDGLMALFFLLVGLELKREALEGNLSRPDQIALPALAAIGGMAVPALVYAAINAGDPVALEGWAIPAATDIAFAMAILVFLADRVPLALRVFLVTVAIFDDVGAIVVIALFYTDDLSLQALAVSGACLPALWWLNRRGVVEKAPYLLIGVVMWAALLQSGVHATLAGVALALFIPLRTRNADVSPLRQLEHDLHPSVAYATLPLFAFTNAGLVLTGIGSEALLDPVTLGIILGLVVGKPLGVLGACWLGVRAGLVRLPEELRWSHITGASLLCGVGFTMSLFIGALAFGGLPEGTMVDERLGIVVGSTVAAIAGFLVLRFLTDASPERVERSPVRTGTANGTA
jgi:NhaA family Na+:H+ antiporter